MQKNEQQMRFESFHIINRCNFTLDITKPLAMLKVPTGNKVNHYKGRISTTIRSVAERLHRLFKFSFV